MENKKKDLSFTTDYSTINKIFLNLTEALQRIVLPDSVKSKIQRSFQSILKRFFKEKTTTIEINVPIEGTVLYTKDNKKYVFNYSIIPGINSWEVFIIKDSSEEEIKPLIGIVINIEEGKTTICNKKQLGSLIVNMTNPEEKEIAQYGISNILKEECLPYTEEEKNLVLGIFERSFVVDDALERNLPYRKESSSKNIGFYKIKEHGFIIWKRFKDEKGFINIILDEGKLLISFYKTTYDFKIDSIYSKNVSWNEFKCLNTEINYDDVKEFIQKAKNNGFDCSMIPEDLVKTKEKEKIDDKNTQ